ncbi:MAG: hypothetical protein JWQ20_3466 [Conexibacter sp.]|nr:hypothetical protein [Conexibacter sp.]
MRRSAVSSAVLTVTSALTVAVEVASASPAHRPEAVVAPSVAPVTAGFMLTREPVVVVEGTSDGAPYFQVRVRLNRSLPVDRQGVRANFLVGRSGSDATPVPFGRRSRHCYASSVGNDVKPDPNLAHVTPGSKVRLTVRITGHQQIVRTVTLRSSRYIELRTLGCGVRR